MANTFRYDPTRKVIIGYYNNNINIESLHECVMKVLFEESTDIIQDIVNDGLEVAAHPDISVEDGINFFSRLISGVGEFASQAKSSEYVRRSQPWLRAIEEEPSGDVKNELIIEYISLINKFVRTNIQFAHPNGSSASGICYVCYYALDDIDDHCIRCGAFVAQYVLTGKYIDSNEDNSKPSKSLKDPYNKFRERYLRHQGRSSNTIAKEDLEKISAHLNTSYTLTTTEEFRADNRRLLRGVLVKMKLGKYKDDLNLLMNELWKYPPPNYSHLDDIIEANWRAGELVFEANKDEQDAHTISHNDWRIYKELTDVGIECDESDFQIASNKQTQRRYKELWDLRNHTLAGALPYAGAVVPTAAAAPHSLTLRGGDRPADDSSNHS